MINIIKKLFILLICSSLFFCQPAKEVKKTNFDNNLFSKISLNANNKTINSFYEAKFSDPYIDHSIKDSPLLRLNNWLDENIINFGSYNKLVIEILDASIIRKEQENLENKKYEEKIIYYYELNYQINFILFDDNDEILATTQVLSKHSTTSSKFISLNEKEKILNSLIFNGLLDLSNKTSDLLKTHMQEYIL